MAENIDSSYFMGGDTLGGAYLGQSPARSGYYVPSWIKSDKEDVRGSDPYAQIALNPGTSYRLVDYSGENEGKVLGQGSTLADIEAMQKIINEQLVPLGRKADWRIQEVSNAPIDPATGSRTYTTGSSVDPVTGQYYTTLGGDYYNKPSIAGPIADIALPLAMNFLIPGSGLLHGALTAAGGSILSGVAQGKPIGDIAKGALISGAGGALGGALGGAGSAASKGTSLGLSPAFQAARGAAGSLLPAISGSVGSGLGAGLGALGGSLADEIAVTAGRIGSGLGSAAGTAAGTAAGGALNAALTPRGTSQYQPPAGETVGQPLTVTGSVSSGAPSLAAGIGGAGAQAVQAAERALAEKAARDAGETFDEEQVVEASRQPPSVINTPAIPFPSFVVPSPVNVPDLSVQPEAPATTEDEIVVTAKPDFPGSLEGLVAPLVTLGPSAIPGTAADATPKKKLGVSDYLKLAGLASSAIGAAGAGGTSAGTIPGGLGGLNPIFSSQLPTANIPGGVGAASNLAPRQMGEEDWLTYGLRPERSFFDYVPQQPTGMAHGGSLEAKRGGSTPRTSFAVSGPGTGRSDDIPAVLSDGEYVIDAETVALLGDGSSKAGAQKLDDLRVKIRKHKGQKLSQGRFSANAKKPEAYLSGGRI